MTNYIVAYYLGTEFLFNRVNTPIPRVDDIVKYHTESKFIDEFIVKEVCFEFYSKNEELNPITVQLEWR